MSADPDQQLSWSPGQIPSKFIEKFSGGPFRKFMADKINSPQIKLLKLGRGDLTNKASTKLNDLDVRRACHKYFGRNSSRRAKAGRKMKQNILERMECDGRVRKKKCLMEK